MKTTLVAANSVAPIQPTISVNAVHPGTTDTPLTVETFAALASALGKTPEEIRRAAEGATARGRLASGEDIAGVVAFLASGAAEFINGTSINVVAGRSSGLW